MGLLGGFDMKLPTKLCITSQTAHRSCYLAKLEIEIDLKEFMGKVSFNCVLIGSIITRFYGIAFQINMTMCLKVSIMKSCSISYSFSQGLIYLFDRCLNGSKLQSRSSLCRHLRYENTTTLKRERWESSLL